MLTANYVKVTNGMFSDSYIVIVSSDTENNKELIENVFCDSSSVRVVETEVIQQIGLDDLLNAFECEIESNNIKFISK